MVCVLEHKVKLSKTEEQENIFEFQNSQYEFPYHHIPSFLDDGSVIRTRFLGWGFDYCACIRGVISSVKELSPQTLLEVGCGDGVFLGAVQKYVDKAVGVDLSEKAITFAKSFQPNTEFHCADASSISGTFDFVLAMEVLEHIPDSDVSKFLRTLWDKTKPNGHIYISVPSVNLPVYKKHYRHYDRALLSEQIKVSGIDVEFVEIRYFRSPVFLENIYKRLTDNRFFIGEFHPLRRFLWKKICNSFDKDDPKTGLHVVAILKKKQ